MSTLLDKAESGPLLAPGLHPLGLEDLEALCVTRFPMSTTRADIMRGVREVVALLSRHRIVGALWVNGSFLTDKIDPKDADVVLRVDTQLADKGTAEQKAALKWISSNLKSVLLCDSYVFVDYPEGHPLHAIGNALAAYWMKQFGYSRRGESKGIAVVRIEPSSV